MESHKRILGILYIVSGIFQTLILLVLNIFITTILTFALSKADPDAVPIVELIISLMRYLPAIIIIFFALPSIIAGWGLLNKKSWAMILALILGCFKLFSFPIGTALGVYTIWVYSEDHRLNTQPTK